MTPYRTIVVRPSTDETTFAVVEAMVDPTSDADIVTDAGFLRTLRKALTEWAQTSERGHAAFEASDEDFNVGDLSNYVGNTELDQFLAKHGITDLALECFSDHDTNNTWIYDTVLIDKE